MSDMEGDIKASAARREIERLKEEARKQREREKITQDRFIDSELQEFIDEMEEVKVDETGPSARDVLYDNAVSDYDQVSDEYKRKEVQGKWRLFSHMVNMFAKVVEGKEVCTVFFDDSGNVAVKETEFHLG